MPDQREMFENRYSQLRGSGRPGWSDEESTTQSVRMFQGLVQSTRISGGTILELGCGRGNIALEFAKNPEWEVTGVDFSPTAVQWAQEYAQELGVSAEFVQGDLRQNWEFTDDSFDVVIDAHCLHFFHGDERSHFLNETWRILKPKGVFVLSTIVNQPKEEHWKLLGYNPATRTSVMNGVTMNYFIEVPELLGELMPIGFKVLASVMTHDDSDHIWLCARKS